MGSEFSDFLAFLTGVGVTLVVGLFTGRAIYRATADIKKPDVVGEDEWEKFWSSGGKRGKVWIGVLERILFFLCIWSGSIALIAALLAFKVATKWRSWDVIVGLANSFSGGKKSPSAEGATPESGGFVHLTARKAIGSRVVTSSLVGTMWNLLAAFIGVGFGQEVFPAALKWLQC